MITPIVYGQFCFNIKIVFKNTLKKEIVSLISSNQVHHPSASRHDPMIHTVNLYPAMKLDGSLKSLDKAGDKVVHWLENTVNTAFAQ